MQNQLIDVIRHSLNAASTALDLITQQQEAANEPVVHCTAECAAPCVTNDVAEVEGPNEELETLLAELNHPDYRLRTVSELGEKLNLSFDEMADILSWENIGFVTRHRVSDGAPLIGLASRN